MRILVLGGTGFVGKALVKALLNAGYQVRCLVHHQNPFKESRDFGVEVCFGNALDKHALEKCIQDCDVVINLMGIIREFPRRGITFENLHVQATQNIVDLCKKYKIKRYLHMSALGSRKNARARYHQTKYRAEEYIRESGLIYTIFKPSFIFGKEDKSINKFAQLLRFKVFPIFGRNSKFQPVFVEDVAKIYTLSIRNKKTFRKTFEIGGPKIYTFRELLQTLGRLTQRKALIMAIPLLLIKPLVKIFEKIPFFPLAIEQLTMLQEDNITQDKRIWEILKIKPRSLEEEFVRYH